MRIIAAPFVILALAASPAAQVQYVVPFGSGCGGTNGTPRLGACPGSTPRLGNPFCLEITNLPPSPATAPFLCLGFRPSAPIPLDVIGMAGCDLLVDADAVFSMWRQGARATFELPISSDPQWLGALLFSQSFVVDQPPAPATWPNALGVTVSNGVIGVIGDRIHASVVEEFADESMLDTARSAGRWTSGIGTFSEIGGAGVHGDFDHTRGVFDAATSTWIIDTSGPWAGDANALVTNSVPSGSYEFTRFHVPAGVNVRFTGPFPAEISVRGECLIEGRLDFGGEDVGRFENASNVAQNAPGQPGGAPGPGGGRGGAGGQQCDGLGMQPAFDGRPGDDVVVPASHAYAAMSAGTGGPGAQLFPRDGLIGSVVFNVFSYSGMAAAGGGGGGLGGTGGTGEVSEAGRTSTDPTSIPTPPPTPGGRAFPLSPLPGGASREHFAVGGSGGGGGASHPFYQRHFIAGAAGAGGGGVAGFHVGRRFALTPDAMLANRGGSSTQTVTNQGIGVTFPGPGGAGSGGSVLVQVGTDDVALGGTIDVRGGVGGKIHLIGALFRGNIVAGDGADGTLRIEAVQLPDTSRLQALPPVTDDDVGILTERDPQVGMMSKHYGTGLQDAPAYTRYRIAALVDGVPTVFSDDPSLGVPATSGAPLRFHVQGIDVDANGRPVAGAVPSPWRTRVGPGAVPSLDDDGRNGFRWTLIADRSVARSVVVDRVEVEFSY